MTTRFDDDDLVLRLQGLADDIPLPPTLPDDDLRRGRDRLRRLRVLAASGAAAAVALLVGGVSLVTGINRADGPGPVEPPTSAPTTTQATTQSAMVSRTPGPSRVAFLRDYDGGFFAVGDDTGLPVWRRDEDGWHEVTRLSGDEFDTSPDGRYLLISTPNRGAGVNWEVSEDGGRRWHRLDLPEGQCGGESDSRALLNSGIFVATRPCGTVGTGAGWRAYWQPRGSTTWELRPTADLPPSGAYIHAFGDLLVARTSEADGAGIAQMWVSHDTGVSWQEVPYPCRKPTHTDWPYYVNGVVYKVCFEDAGNVVFTLSADDTWTPATTLPPETVDSAFQELGALPLGGSRWLAETSTGLLVVTPDGSTAVDPPFDPTVGFSGIATVGSDIYLPAGRDNGWNRVPLWVSHDGGLTWDREEAP